MQSTGMQRLKPAATALPPRADSLGCHPFPMCFAFFFQKHQGWASSSEKTPVMKKIDFGDPLQHSGSVCLSGKKRKREEEKGKYPWWEFSNPDGRFMPSKAGTAELHWVWIPTLQGTATLPSPLASPCSKPDLCFPGVCVSTGKVWHLVEQDWSPDWAT